MTRCVAHSKRLCIPCAWVTLSFPIEHMLWERLWPLRLLTPILGLH